MTIPVMRGHSDVALHPEPGLPHDDPHRVSLASAAEALELIAKAERESRLLRRLRPARPRLYWIEGRDVTARNPELGGRDRSGPRATDAPTLSVAAAADVIRLGRADQKLRARAFYEDAGMSLVAHGRLREPWPRPAALHRGAEVQERIGPDSGFVLSRTLERGRGLRHAWLVEERVLGRPMDVHEWNGVMPRVLDGLARMWLAAGVRHVPLKRVLPARAATSVLADLEQRSDAAVDGTRLARLARDLLARDELLAYGWCHGDPVRTNFLLLPDGRLALVDWEAASQRALAHDATKTMFESLDPRAHADAVALRLEGIEVPNAMPWRDQLAVATLARLRRSGRRGRWAMVRADPAFQDAVLAARRRNIRLLASLLMP